MFVSLTHCLSAVRSSWRIFLLGILVFWLAGCSSLVEKGGSRLANSLTAAVLNNNDPAIVEAGLPTYLLLMDALALQEPKSPMIQQAAASLTSAYAGAFVKDPARIAALTEKSRSYALTALCQQYEKLCNIREMPVDELKKALEELDDKEEDVPPLYTLGTTWASWIDAHSSDFNAVADLPRVEAILQRVLALDENYQQGMTHLYMGVIATAIPPALGGRPEIGKAHFEKAIALSQGHNLMAKVYFAKNYARGIYDRELHDKLLAEVIEAPAEANGWTLTNLLAKKEAKALQESADDFF